MLSWWREKKPEPRMRQLVEQRQAIMRRETQNLLKEWRRLVRRERHGEQNISFEMVQSELRVRGALPFEDFSTEVVEEKAQPMAVCRRCDEIPEWERHVGRHVLAWAAQVRMKAEHATQVGAHPQTIAQLQTRARRLHGQLKRNK